MAHPQMFDDGDKVLKRVRALAMEFPGAAEKISHGRPAFFTKKVFGYYGASVRLDGNWIEHANAIVVAAEASEREALLDDKRFFVPAYLGAYGWIGFDLIKPDWDEVRELFDASYRLTAPAKLVQQLTSDVALK